MTTNTVKRFMLIAAAAIAVAIPPPTAAQQAPNRRDVVQAVRDAHPEINPCDEDSLEKGRAAIVDWAAQRLNRQDGGIIRWGRKARQHNGGNPNTDALTYLLPDGRFEIYDVMNGTPPCHASWDGDGRPWKQGENGWWVEPLLGPEPGDGPPPSEICGNGVDDDQDGQVDEGCQEPPPPDGAATAELQRQQLAALALLIQGQQQQIGLLQRQNEALLKAVQDLKAEIAKGVKIRF